MNYADIATASRFRIAFKKNGLLIHKFFEPLSKTLPFIVSDSFWFIFGQTVQLASILLCHTQSTPYIIRVLTGIIVVLLQVSIEISQIQHIDKPATHSAFAFKLSTRNTLTIAIESSKVALMSTNLTNIEKCFVILFPLLVNYIHMVVCYISRKYSPQSSTLVFLLVAIQLIPMYQLYLVLASCLLLIITELAPVFSLIIRSSIVRSRLGGTLVLLLIQLGIFSDAIVIRSYASTIDLLPFHICVSLLFSDLSAHLTSATIKGHSPGQIPSFHLGFLWVIGLFPAIIEVTSIYSTLWLIYAVLITLSIGLCLFINIDCFEKASLKNV